MTITNDTLINFSVPAQVPLDAKLYVVSEDDLKNLGTNNYKAFSYYKGMRVLCAQERTVYEWREMEEGLIGLLPNNFTYPPNVYTEGIDYSNKIYNFIEVIVELNQNNIVKSINILKSNLEDTYTKEDIIIYILNLDEVDRTINEITSKINFCIIDDTIEYNNIIEIYELQNHGKGIITTIDIDNDLLLIYTTKVSGLQKVLNVNEDLNLKNIINLLTGSLNIVSPDAPTNQKAGLFISGESMETIESLSTIELGISNDEMTSIIRGFRWLIDKTIFTDNLAKGLEYGGDYSANFNDNSLITKLFTLNAINTAIAALPPPTPPMYLANGSGTTISGTGSLVNPFKVNINNNNVVYRGYFESLDIGTTTSFACYGDILSVVNFYRDTPEHIVTVTMKNALPSNYVVDIRLESLGSNMNFDNNAMNAPFQKINTTQFKIAFMETGNKTQALRVHVAIIAY